MKKYFFIGLAGVVIIVIGIISYGAYLNKAGENQIAMRMAERTIPLQGSIAKVRDIKTRVILDTVNLYSNEMTDAVALIDGRITAVNVKKNDFVGAGQILFNLTNEDIPLKIKQAEIDTIKADSEILKAENDIVKAETYLARAKNDYVRYGRLRDNDAISAEKFDEIVAAYKEAQLNLEVAQLQKQQVIAQKDSFIAQKEQLLVENSHSQVTAPIDGEVLILYKQIGSYVTAGTPLALVGNFRTLYFSIPVEDELARKLNTGKNVSLDFNRAGFTKVYDTEYEAGNAGNNQQVIARISEISPNMSERAAMRTVIFEVGNSTGLLEPQTYNNVEIKSLFTQKCLTVPISAMTDPSNSSVFVVNDGVLEKRNITTGIDDGDYIEILSGLKEGETVITSGTAGLEDGMKANVILEVGENG